MSPRWPWPSGASKSTPRAQMNLYPLDTFPYEFPGKEIKIRTAMNDTIAITRGVTDPATGNPINAVTHFLDLSQVYGSDPATAASLRLSN